MLITKESRTGVYKSINWEMKLIGFDNDKR